MLYSEDPAWSDVVPLKQYDAVPLAPIFYTDEYQDASDYLRGVIKVGETSERVLKLTERIIRLNAAHYTAWQYRYKTLIAIGASLKTERELMDVLALKYLKNYQVWHHRRLLLGALRDETIKAVSGDVQSAQDDLNALAMHELEFSAKVLDDDAKNYHTWSYRQWVLTSAADEAVWAGELPYVEQLLKHDVRNNSAWHHRFFVVFTSGVRQGDVDRYEVLKRELRVTKQAISLVPNNSSAWNYLRGVLEHMKVPFSELKDFVAMYASPREPGPSAFDDTDLENPAPTDAAKLPCPGALEFMAEIYEEDEASLPQATKLYDQLGEQYDTIRKKYWEHRVTEARQRHGEIAT